MSTLKEKHNQHIFTITTELDPPKSASSSVTEAQVVKVAPYVDAVNIADCPMAKMRMSPIALSSIIQSRYQVESIFHLTCRDRNVIGLQAHRQLPGPGVAQLQRSGLRLVPLSG